jgi:hypothetical protein
LEGMNKKTNQEEELTSTIKKAKEVNTQKYSS